MDTTYSYSAAPARPVLGRDRPGRASTASDAELVAASVRDPVAFTELFERHWDGLYRFCVNRAGSAGEDIAAESFRCAFDGRKRYDRRYGDARPWLFGIATNLLREHFRTARREAHKLERSAALSSGSSGSDMDQLERRLLGPQLAEALQGIPAADRDALVLLAWADLDYEQIAQALDIPLGTVRSRIHRARQRVRECLDANPESAIGPREAST
jgi:RNA polymerase sigma-70 factor (ECF subfamily)